MVRMDDTQKYMEGPLHVGRGSRSHVETFVLVRAAVHTHSFQFLVAHGRGGREFRGRQAPFPRSPNAKGLFYRPAKSQRMKSLVIQIKDKCSSLYFVFPKGMNQMITSPEATQRVIPRQK